MAIVSEDNDSTFPSQLDSSCSTLTRTASQSSLSILEWEQASTSAHYIANNSNNHQLRSHVGTTTATIDSIARLLRNLLDMDDSQEVVKARMECCRVIGNLCFDHDENRQLVLDSGIPQLIMETIHTTTRYRGEQCDESGNETKRRVLRIEELKLLRAAAGATMNSSLKFDPMRKHLASTPSTFRSLLSLVDNRPNSRSTQPVYVVGQWKRESGGMSEEEWQERLELGEMIAGWTMNVLEDILSEDNSNFPSPDGIPILASIVLSLPFSSHPSPTSSSPPSISSLSLSSPSASSDSDDTSSLDTSIELVSISSALLEGLVLDHSTHKQTLASPTTTIYSNRLTSPQPESTLLYKFFDFLEFARPPLDWVTNEDERNRLKKTFRLVKTAIGRSVVECPNEDLVMHEVWKEGEWVVERMKNWLMINQNKEEEDREDLIICASHFLAGLGRTDEYTERLVHQYELVEPLVSIVKQRVPKAVSPPPSEGSTGGENTQILYGVISLLRHLAIPLKNRQIVSETRIVGLLTELLRDKMDIVKLLQMSVVGLLKHLTNLNIPNSLDLLSTHRSDSTSDERQTTPLDLILALIKRTDELQLRSESTRILVNLIRSLFSVSPSTSSEAIDRRKEIVLEKKEIISAVSEQVRRSGKYPVLVNEGIVALSLVSGNGEKGASLVLASLVDTPSTSFSPLPTDPSTRETSLTSSSQPPRRTSQSSDSPSTSLDQLLHYLSSTPTIDQSGTSGIRPEMIVNVCTLLITTLKNGSSHENQTVEASGRVRETLEEVGEGEGREGKEWDAIRILRKVVKDGNVR